MKLNKRNFGIDLLRLVSMFMVVLLHILGWSGMLSSTLQGTTNYKIAWFLEIGAYCAVNCYALITGYVSVEGNFKPIRIIHLWLQVIFYTLSITLFFKFFTAEPVGLSNFIRAAFPIIKNEYWFFTAYFATFFFIPFMNKLVENLDKIQYKKLVVTLIFMFTILPTLSLLDYTNPSIDLFNLSFGYSFVWLMALYLIGGYIKKYGFGKMLNKNFYLLGYTLTALFLWGSKMILESLSSPSLFKGEFISYSSPLVLLMSVFLVIYFSQLKINKVFLQKLITHLSPAAFGVYILHHQAYIKEFITEIVLLTFPTLTPVQFIVKLFFVVFFIFSVCLGIDLIRIKLFKLLNLSAVASYIDKKTTSFFNKII